MSELRECPFCGGEAKVNRHDPEKEGVWCLYSIECPTCQENYHGADDYGWDLSVCGNSLDKLIDIWNTRAERTCRKVPGKMRYGDRKPKCSECGYGLGDPRWTYCPSCGAKVTDLHTAIEDAIGEVIERYPNTMDMLGDE